MALRLAIVARNTRVDHRLSDANDSAHMRDHPSMGQTS